MREVEGRTFPHRLIVIRFKGDCTTGKPARTANGALGHTHITDGEILPFIEIDCNRLLGYLQSSPENAASDGNEYGTALGRVVSHEIYHVIGATTRHGRRGVAKATLTVEELTEGILTFDSSESLLIRERLTSPKMKKRSQFGRTGP
jgi:hypothetical protein